MCVCLLPRFLSPRSVLAPTRHTKRFSVTWGKNVLFKSCGRQRAIRWHRLVNGTDIRITNTNCPAYPSHKNYSYNTRCSMWHNKCVRMHNNYYAHYCFLCRVKVEQDSQCVFPKRFSSYVSSSVNRSTGSNMTKCALDLSDLPQTVCASSLKILKEEQLPLSLAEIKFPIQHAMVHALVACVSPNKPSRYFDGELTDGGSVFRTVGFDRKQKQQLDSFCDKKIPITISDCQIQLKFQNKLEVVLKSKTQVEEANIEFDVPDLKTVESSEIQLNRRQEEYGRVTVRVMVLIG